MVRMSRSKNQVPGRKRNSIELGPVSSIASRCSNGPVLWERISTKAGPSDRRSSRMPIHPGARASVAELWDLPALLNSSWFDRRLTENSLWVESEPSSNAGGWHRPDWWGDVQCH